MRLLRERIHVARGSIVDDLIGLARPRNNCAHRVVVEAPANGCLRHRCPRWNVLADRFGKPDRGLEWDAREGLANAEVFAVGVEVAMVR